MRRLVTFSLLLGLLDCGAKKRTTPCDAGMYRLNGVCTDAGIGYYAESSTQKTCTNAPANAHYTSTNATSANCPWDCDTNYLVNNDGTACTSRANTVTLACGTNEVAVGVYGRTGSWMDKLGVRCATYSSGVVGTIISNGASTGGSGGSAFVYDCPADSVLVEVSGKNGVTCSPSSTSYHQYNCLNLTTNALSGLSAKYGEASPSGCPGQTAFDLSCPSGRYAYGITVDADGTGTYVGYTLGVNCR